MIMMRVRPLVTIKLEDWGLATRPLPAETTDKTDARVWTRLF